MTRDTATAAAVHDRAADSDERRAGWPAVVSMNPADLDRRDVQAMVDGDEAAFARIYQRYRDRVHRFAYRMLRSGTVAEDATHEVFLALLKAPERYSEARGSLLTYLCAIARHQVLRHFRRSEYEAEPAGETAGGGDNLLGTLLEKERADQVSAAIDELPPLQREVVLLREFEELSYSEIADVVGADVNVVKGRLHRARQALARRLSPHRVEWRTPIVTCQYTAMIEALHDDALEASDAARARAHLAACDACAGALHRLDDVRRAIRELPAPLPSPSLDVRVARSFAQQRAAAQRKRGWTSLLAGSIAVPRWAVAAAAAGFITVLAGAGYIASRAPASVPVAAFPPPQSQPAPAASALPVRVQIVEVPVYRERVVTRTVYVAREPRKATRTADRSAAAPLLEDAVSDNSYITRASLAGFEPPAEITARVVRNER